MTIETQYTGHGSLKTLERMYAQLSDYNKQVKNEREYTAYYDIWDACNTLYEALHAIDARAEDKPDYEVTRPYGKAYNMAMRQLREQKEKAVSVEIKRIYNVAISSLTVAKNNSMK